MDNNLWVRTHRTLGNRIRDNNRFNRRTSLMLRLRTLNSRMDILNSRCNRALKRRIQEQHNNNPRKDKLKDSRSQTLLLSKSRRKNHRISLSNKNRKEISRRPTQLDSKRWLRIKIRMHKTNLNQKDSNLKIRIEGRP